MISYTSPTYCHKGLDLLVGDVGDNLVKKTKIEILLCEIEKKEKIYRSREKMSKKLLHLLHIL